MYVAPAGDTRHNAAISATPPIGVPEPTTTRRDETRPVHSEQPSTASFVDTEAQPPQPFATHPPPSAQPSSHKPLKTPRIDEAVA
eukprot:7489949-Pyramimonas_sp.AAC.1